MRNWKKIIFVKPTKLRTICYSVDSKKRTSRGLIHVLPSWVQYSILSRIHKPIFFSFYPQFSNLTVFPFWLFANFLLQILVFIFSFKHLFRFQVNSYENQICYTCYTYKTHVCSHFLCVSLLYFYKHIHITPKIVVKWNFKHKCTTFTSTF